MTRLAVALLPLALMAQSVLAQVAILPGDRFRSWTRDDANLKDFESFFVVKERRGEDDEEEEGEFQLDIDLFIVDALLQLGLTASSGEADQMPSATEVKVTYESFYRESKRTSGVTDLVMYFRDPATNAVIALADMEKVQDWPGPDIITAAVRYLIDRSVGVVESPYSASELTKAYEAEATDPEGDLPEFAARGAIRIVNAQPSVRWPIIYPMRLVAKKEYVDHHQLLEVAKAALEQEIREAGGVIVAEGGDKTITLRVTDLANIAIVQTFLNFTLETGDGYVHGYQAFGKHWNYRKSVDAAVADVTVQVLSDPSVIAYLAR